MKFLIGLLFLAISLNAQVLATVNNQDITTEDVNRFLKSTGQDLEYDVLEQKAKNLALHQTIERRLLLQEALKENLDKTDNFKTTIEGLKKSLLVELYMKDEFKKIKVSKDEVENYYKLHSDEFKQDKKLKLRHIVVDDLKLAVDIINKLNNASNKEVEFIKLAEQYSLDDSKKDGGNLDWLQKNDTTSEFWDAAVALKTGDYSKEPIKTPFGYHIIFLDEIQEPMTIKLDKVYTNIENEIKMQKFQSAIDEKIKEIKKNANIVIK